MPFMLEIENLMNKNEDEAWMPPKTSKMMGIKLKKSSKRCSKNDQ
jgi:hypothetical protein